MGDGLTGDALVVRRRRVLYMTGYDPRRPVVYRDLFARELSKAAALRGYDAGAGALDERNAIAPGFTMTASADGHPVEAVVLILRWDDLIRPVYKSPVIPRLPQLLGVGFDLLRRGVIGKIARLDWQFSTFLIYPYAMTLFAILSVLAVGISSGVWAARLSPFAALPAALIGATLAGWIWLRIERRLYLRYLLEDWLFSFAHERRAQEALAARVDAFADLIAEAAADPTIDEVLVIGHSSGAFLAPEALALALDRDPDLRSNRAVISLLTIGSMASLMLLVDGNSRYGSALERLSEEPGITWYEVQARHDFINMCPVDPIAVSGRFADGKPAWPRILRLSMPGIVKPGQLKLFRERLSFFKNHFRFVAANERIDWYDFYGMMVGPQTLAARLSQVPAIFRPAGDAQPPLPSSTPTG